MSSGKYDDIIDLPRPRSNARPKMSNHDRAAQFSPFAALVGYDDAVKETARLTDEMTALDDEKIAELGEKIRKIYELVDKRPTVTVRYFVPDGKKTGGKYISVTGGVKRVDVYGSKIIMSDGKEILMDLIVDIEGDIFSLTE